MLLMLTIAHYMSERITIVVPDGTRKKLNDEAKAQGRSKSNLARKYVLDGLSGSSVILKGSDLDVVINRGSRGQVI